MSLTISSKLPHTVDAIFLLWNLVLSQSHCCLCPSQILGVFSLSPQGMAPREVLLPPHFHIQTILPPAPWNNPPHQLWRTPPSATSPLSSTCHLAIFGPQQHSPFSFTVLAPGFLSSRQLLISWFLSDFSINLHDPSIPVSQVRDFHSFSHLAFIILHQPFPLVVVLHSLQWPITVTPPPKS